MNWITICALIMIGIGSVGAIFLVFGQSKDSAKDKQDLIDLTKTENIELKVKLLELQQERNNLKSDLETRDHRINSQTQTIIDLNQKLIDKSEYISNHLTGGKGFAIVTTSSVKSIDPKMDEVTTFTLHNETNLPLYDITAVIFDWNYIKSKTTGASSPGLPNLMQDDLVKSTIYRFDEAQMSEETSIICKDRFDLKGGLLYIRLKCRSSFVFEKMAFVTENRSIYQGFMVYDSHGTILKEWFSPSVTESAKLKIKEKFDSIPNKVSFQLTR